MEFKLVERNVESSKMENLQKQLSKSTKRNQHQLKLGEYDENVEEIRSLVEEYHNLSPLIQEEVDFMAKLSALMILLLVTDFFIRGPLTTCGLGLISIVGIATIIKHRGLVHDRSDIFKDIEYLHGENCCTIYSIARDLKSELEGSGKDYTAEDIWLESRKNTPALVIINSMAGTVHDDNQKSN